ncbi:hypothetical protein [Alicyclobacillus sp. ALC3]|uniref:hypothetical protein n=1 Tax=Alicyclobacillus sp. ALC3 TaxID=2796143 RepID=UPI0019D4856B|nr:hypothetical protein [Alicyclobacillus sp. ALC3]QSO53149.1 hypothetical protein JZ785_04475 [Alicyclobacillus curvatus]WDL96489.1 hypothetical protein JC200_19560 [Alicyclobacillus sp. ALC3]
MLYLAFPIDLRDRFKASVWLAYVGKIQETEFRTDDTLVVGEWMFPQRDTLLQTLGRVRQSGARVVFIGQVEHESDDFKRELCLLGIYDFLFVGDELVLQELDTLLAHGRSEGDVAAYLHRDEGPIGDPPKLIDVFEGADEPIVWQPLVEGDDAKLARFDTFLQPGVSGTSQTDRADNRYSRPVRRFVWPDPMPLRVRILGDPGCGKSFVALQLASLCHGRELPAAVVEDNVATIKRWCEESLSSHIFAIDPPKGYRVILDTRLDGDTPLSDIDLILVVTWPDADRIAETLRPLQNQAGLLDRVLCIVNHDSAGVVPTHVSPLPMVRIPHEPRQFHAMRMRTSLVDLDPYFANLFLPMVERISTSFMDPNRQRVDGGDRHDLVAGA